MTTLENYIARQDELYDRISRSVENLQNLGGAKLTRGHISSRLESLKVNWHKFQDLHEILFKARTEETSKLPYFQNHTYSLCEEKFLESQGTMLDLLDGVAVDTNNSATISAIENPNAHSRRLPRIDLPKFAGEYAQWSHFRDLFSSMIRDNPTLSPVEKLHYLKMSLKGEPSQLLKNLAVSAENFERAWETLTNRYQNRRILIDAQLSALFSAKALKSESATDLKRLIGDIQEARGALETLQCPVKQWDNIIVYMTVRKLDSESLKDWEKTIGAKTEPPSFSDLETFLIGRIHTLEAIEMTATARKSGTGTGTGSSTRQSTGARSFAASTPEQKCSLCNAEHYISLCQKYISKTPTQRREFAMSKHLCYNCLGPHLLKDCRSSKRCRVCRAQHHTTLHGVTESSTNLSITTQSTTTTQPNPASDVDTSTTSRTANYVAQPYLRLSQSVLLATAVVNVAARGGEPIQARALLDQGSEVSFISEPLAQLLKVRRRPASVPIVGIGAHQTNVARGATSIKIISRVDSSFSLVIDALILPKLTSYLPSSSPLNPDWPHLKDLNLADPSFASPGKIDLFLGVSVYAQILQDEVRKDRPDAPIAQKTAFGWMLSGPTPCITPNYLQHERVQGFQCSLDHELLELLQRFWSLEEVPTLSEQTLTPDELQCEDHFKNTFIRDGEGRFIVRLPIKRDLNDLGKSYTSSHRMLLRMEKRFTNDYSLRKAYIGFMNEYRELDHMRASTTRNQQPRHHFFLPHHGVLNKNSSTTKLRVVFNGSQTTDSGISLNECLHVGPKLQTDIADVLLRWRRHPFVFATDNVKMYRQIRVHPDDWPLQQILWRESQNEEPQAFSLCTVTYGLTCALCDQVVRESA